MNIQYSGSRNRLGQRGQTDQGTSPGAQDIPISLKPLGARNWHRGERTDREPIWRIAHRHVRCLRNINRRRILSGHAGSLGGRRGALPLSMATFQWCSRVSDYFLPPLLLDLLRQVWLSSCNCGSTLTFSLLTHFLFLEPLLAFLIVFFEDGSLGSLGN
ncbi:hypothetical protein EDD85DRAFT_839251 [Armillaria nabsnona]|nr:hypothetical protein EDD85DRAFT_839251 [Armillaria nabsnona]